MRDERTHISLGWFVLLACLLHLCASLIVFTQKELTSSLLAKKDSKKELELVDPKTLENRDVVETSRLKNQDPELLKKKAPFYSEETNRVKEETRSQLHGRFQQGTILTQQGEEEGTDLPLGDKGEKQATKKGQSPNLKDLMLFSRTPNELPKEIREGAETVLNTDKVLYASFINRITEAVYDPWVSNLETAIRETKFRDKKLETNLYVTKLLITMDKEGEIKGIKLMKSSGNDEIDDAPKRAFWALEGFRNPPEQLLSEDGYIRLPYEFHLDYKNSGFNIVSGRL